MNKSLLLLIGITALTSCIELGNCPRNIPLSTHKVTFSSAPDSTTVTTGNNDGWWLSDITVDGVEYNYGLDQDMNYLIKIDSLTFERIEGTTILLKVGQNTTLNNRRFTVTLQYGNCFRFIEIIQSSN